MRRTGVCPRWLKRLVRAFQASHSHRYRFFPNCFLTSRATRWVAAFANLPWPRGSTTLPFPDPGEPAGRSIALPRSSNACAHQSGSNRNRHSRFTPGSPQPRDHHTAHPLLALTFKMSHAAQGPHLQDGPSPALAQATGSALFSTASSSVQRNFCIGNSVTDAR